MSEFFGSVAEYFKSRMRTPVYALFSFWWVTLHWEFFYTLIFIDQKDILEHTGYLKNEYLRMTFVNYSDSAFWWSLLVTVLLAAFLTFLFVWVVPRLILLPAYRKQKEHEYDKNRVKVNLEKAIERLNVELHTEQTTQVRAAEKKSRVIRSASPEVRMEREFLDFKASPLYSHFHELINALYQENGDARAVSSEVLAYAEANDLVEYDRSEMQITPTEKGKFFIKSYQIDPPGVS